MVRELAALAGLVFYAMGMLMGACVAGRTIRALISSQELDYPRMTLLILVALWGVVSGYLAMWG